MYHLTSMSTKYRMIRFDVWTYHCSLDRASDGISLAMTWDFHGIQKLKVVRLVNYWLIAGNNLVFLNSLN